MGMNLNPIKDSGGREEKKRDKKILVDADSCHLKAPGDGDGDNYDYDDKILEGSCNEA